MHGRSTEKSEKAAGAVRAAGGENATVHALAADLASLKQVRQLAADVHKVTGGQLDVLVQNAGVFAERMQKSEDGFELTWAVNVVAPFLLQSLLLSQVKDRIVNVSSISASASLDWGNLNQEKGFSSHTSYSQSKLAMQMITAELAHRLGTRQPSANCLDPGTVNTKMLLAGWGACGDDIEDANDEFWLATTSEVKDRTGQYFVSRKPSRLGLPAQNPADRARLWNILAQQSGLTSSEGTHL